MNTTRYCASSVFFWFSDVNYVVKEVIFYLCSGLHWAEFVNCPDSRRLVEGALRRARTLRMSTEKTKHKAGVFEKGSRIHTMCSQNCVSSPDQCGILFLRMRKAIQLVVGTQGTNRNTEHTEPELVVNIPI